MSWNTQPQKASLPPQYRKIQPAFPPQYAANQLSTSQSSFSCLSSNQEACMYLSNSNTVSQPLPNVRNYNIPLQIPASNLPNRSVVASQTIERTVYANAKGPMKANQNLQVRSGVTQNLRWKSLMMNSTTSQMEATTSRHSHFGTNPANSHALQSQRVAPDTYSVQLQAMQDSPRVPVALQGSQGSNQSLSNQQVDWAQQRASDELPYPDHRPLPKQHFYSAQSFLQDPSVHKKILMSSAPSQITHNQLPASVQSNQPAAILYQYTLQASTKPPPPPPHDCRYGNQPLQGAQHVTKHLSVDVLQGPQIHSSEVKKDFFPGFQPQWQSTNENVAPFGNSCDVKADASVKQPFMEPARSVDGVQTLSQNNQEKKMDSYNPPSSQGTDPAVTKEKLARDIKSLLEIKKKFSELARKIKINKDLLMAAGCKPNNSLSSEQPAQHPEFSKEIPAKGHCPAELVKTCLNLWKNQPSRVTEEKPSKSGEEKHANESLTNISAGISKPLEFPIQNPCSAERNPQNKMENALQEALSMLVQNYEPSCANVTKGTELQIAVVSPLILSNVIKEITPGALPETMYPVIKEGSICSLQNQLAENAAVTAALKVDVSKPVMTSMTSARVFPLIQKEMQNEPNNGDSQNTPGIHKEQCCQLNGPQSLSKPKDRILVAGDLLQIEDICSLVEGDVSYNSKIAEMFNSSLENVEPQKLSLPNEQVISTGHQEEQVRQTSESKDLGLQNNEYTRCTDFPCEIAPVREEPPKLVGSSSEPVEPGILEESNLGKTTKNEGIAKNSHYSPPAVLQQDFNSGDINTSGDDAVQGPAASELHDDNTSVLYIHDQLSELLKEFPYGIEGLNECKSFASQKKMEQIPEDQTGGKIICDPKEPTDQIKITILSSEQMKELFPEQDEPSGDRLPPAKLDKLAETQKKKHVAEVGSQCDPQTQEEGESPDSVVDTDNIHCCALGWLAMIYEGVPKCRCNAVEGKREEQLVPVESSSCKQRPEQGPQTSGADLTIVKLDSVSSNPKTPVTDEKTHLPKIHGNNTKDSSKTKDDTKRRRQELPGEVPPKWKSSDKKDTSKMKQGTSANMGQELTGQFSSKCKEPDPLQRNKKLKLKFHEVKFQSSDKITISDPVSQEGPEKKYTPQNSCQLNPKTGLLPNKGLKRENNSFVQSSSQEKKKLKFKESPQERHLEKRKIDQGERLDLEIKKKKYSEQEQSKNAGVTVKFCNTLPNPNEKAITKENLTSKAKSLEVNDTRSTATVKEKTASQMKSTDSKVISETSGLKDKAASLAKSSGTKDGLCKVKKVITLQEYFQRKKQKEITKTAKKTCLENVLGNSAPSGSVQLSAQAESCRKSNGKGDSSIETLKDASKVNSNPGKNLKAHPPEESKACNLSRSVEGRADAKQLIKTKLDKTLSSVSSEVSSQGKEQRKSYLNRLSFRCTERESICLTTLSTSLAKLGKDKKSQEQKPKASLPGKDCTVKPGMLEFKLCPDVMLKNTNSVEDKYDLRAHPEAQAAMQVSGIKCSRKDWIKCVTEKKTMQEASQGIGVNSRLLQRSASADGQVQQNQVKDSRAMFQTYKQLYLQKRGRSLGSSPVQ